MLSFISVLWMERKSECQLQSHGWRDMEGLGTAAKDAIIAMMLGILLETAIDGEEVAGKIFVFFLSNALIQSYISVIL